METGGKGKLVAVFVVTPETRKAYEAKLSTGLQGQNLQVSVEQWFPAELTSMAEVAGETSIPGVAYPAADFFQTPFDDGRVVFIPQTDYIVLELTSK